LSHDGAGAETESSDTTGEEQHSFSSFHINCVFFCFVWTPSRKTNATRMVYFESSYGNWHAKGRKD
jgi:hypothetical protein